MNTPKKPTLLTESDEDIASIFSAAAKLFRDEDTHPIDQVRELLLDACQATLPLLPRELLLDAVLLCLTMPREVYAAHPQGFRARAMLQSAINAHRAQKGGAL